MHLLRCAVLQNNSSNLPCRRLLVPFHQPVKRPCHVGAGQEVGYDGVRYTRCNNNPSQEVVATKLAALEGEQRVTSWVTLQVTMMMTLSVTS
jgi:hypothetical protein